MPKLKYGDEDYVDPNDIASSIDLFRTCSECGLESDDCTCEIRGLENGAGENGDEDDDEE